MKKIIKKWKPGQLVTANGKVYRVFRSPYTIICGCYACRAINGKSTPCRHSYKEWEQDKEDKLFSSRRCKTPEMCCLKPL